MKGVSPGVVAKPADNFAIINALGEFTALAGRDPATGPTFSPPFPDQRTITASEVLVGAPSALTSTRRPDPCLLNNAGGKHWPPIPQFWQIITPEPDFAITRIIQLVMSLTEAVSTAPQFVLKSRQYTNKKLQ
ncbi:MAG: hypothetical protein P3T54_04645 [Dehalogenimonas sp.]|uniref:Uncharacterized protein n=1 Tax=Candidatus Dehalogenimonas loeffleri TaxID=3127115 RepID=A0ABZ2J8P5_9CHLR|nr:hypothetical protein [Dehalogenimonas sp.]